VNGDYYDARLDLSSVLDRRGLPAEAELERRKVLDDPKYQTHESAARTKAWWTQQRGRAAEAMEAWQQVLSLDARGNDVRDRVAELAYPSLHLTRDLGDVHRLQLSYSHRVDRPDGGDLNPYVDYEDPSHLHAGNPALRPEDVHSIEAGYEYRAQDTTYLASIYHRYRYNGITDVTRFLDDTTLITTPENVGTSRSSGLELGATTRWRKHIALNFSANVYRHEIDARNLGFNGRREATAWDAKLNAHWDVNDRLMLQLNTSYRAKRLTPQGERRPSAITNLGVRYDLRDRKTSLIATVSDVFDTLRDRTVIDTPALQSDITRRRSSRIVYIGFVRYFGKPAKKSGDEMEFDESL
jgi:outer membrane receptor protein involved in Fe transport